MTLDELFERGDIVEFRRYVASCPYRELAILLSRASRSRMEAFEDAVWKAILAREPGSKEIST
jgi:hypothetical protein